MTSVFTRGSLDRSKYKKLEIPIFTRVNPESWVYRVQHYFDVNELVDEEKISRGGCLNTSRLPGEGSLGARLIWIKQDGSYDDYLKKFLDYSASLPEMAKSVLIDAFVTGLETTLQAEVKSRHPTTLEDCMHEAEMVSDRDLAIKLALNERGGRGLGASEGQTQIGINVTYSPGHRCKVKENRKLMFFIANEEEDLEDTNGKEEAEPEMVELENLEVKGETKITLQTILGFTSKGTTKLRGTVKGREVIILIDSGTTHNFIHQGVVKELNLPMGGKTNSEVTISNGTTLEGKGICKRVEVKLPELTIVANF
ncbi:retrotransposon protein [Cucumis melo var. makuwa]|uniref:Retrotransposon protein n=1 Tax=Cucumis melo var. makuwa TaxID=1194695 RepID=A0A5A7UAV8_CUCMM|nr:retrotransposon protein [Cucumis melo var. makuwa]TYK07735.1 retrotransposon protein [Cucumis melo var. makuwa]